MVASIFFLGRWMQFAAGMAAAWVVATHWRENGKLRNAWTGTALFGAAILLYVLATTELLDPVMLPPVTVTFALPLASIGTDAVMFTPVSVR